VALDRRLAVLDPDPGIEQDLVVDRRTAPFGGHQRGDGRERATRAVAGDRQAAVGVQYVGVRRRPLGRPVGVLDRRRERVFGREAVVDRQHHTAALASEVPTEQVVTREAPGQNPLP
jgi:hypothetical protein